jgi:hypothetical protein
MAPSSGTVWGVVGHSLLPEAPAVEGVSIYCGYLETPFQAIMGVGRPRE